MPVVSLSAPTYQAAAGGVPVAIDTHSFRRLSTAVAAITTNAFTIAANSNRALVAHCGSCNLTDITVTSVTDSNGGSWTKLNENIQVGDCVLSIWYNIAPTSGASKTVTANFSGTNAKDLMIEVYSVYNAHQTTPVNNFASAGAPSTLNVTSDSDGMALFSHGAATDPDPITAGTEDSTDVNNLYWRTAHRNASPTATFTYSGIGGRASAGCNVKAA